MNQIGLIRKELICELRRAYDKPVNLQREVQERRGYIAAIERAIMITYSNDIDDDGKVVVDPEWDAVYKSLRDGSIIHETVATPEGCVPLKELLKAMEEKSTIY